MSLVSYEAVPGDRKQVLLVGADSPMLSSLALRRGLKQHSGQECLRHEAGADL